MKLVSGDEFAEGVGAGCSAEGAAVTSFAGSPLASNKGLSPEMLFLNSNNTNDIYCLLGHLIEQKSCHGSKLCISCLRPKVLEHAFQSSTDALSGVTLIPSRTRRFGHLAKFGKRTLRIYPLQRK